MRYSEIFGKTLKNIPADIQLPSHQLLVKGGFIRQVSSGRFAILPLGYLVSEKVVNIIDAKMRELGSLRIETPTLHPIEIWKKTNRDQAFGDLMHVVEDHREAKFALGATAEGLMTELVKAENPTYRDFPILIHQFSQKFRDEMRPRGGLLRVREFMMKDAYSFHTTEDDLKEWYQKYFDAYLEIAKSLDLTVVPVVADSGAIGGDYNHEFMVESGSGEDLFVKCESCHSAWSLEKLEKDENKKFEDGDACPKCESGALKFTRSIEWGHTFNQGQFYSIPHKANFVDQDGAQKPLWQGAYGIGIGRTMATVVETHHDDKGIMWPKNLAPYKVHLTSLGPSEEVSELADKVYSDFNENGTTVLFDDRNVHPGEKLQDMDLIGIPFRVVISTRSIGGGGVEVSYRDNEKSNVVPASQIADLLNSFYT